jgi:RNA polymerase sigma factor (sigma-70 family)
VLAQALQKAKTLACASDGDLLRRYAETGEQEAFAAVVNRHLAMVLGVCRRLLSSQADAEDACQAVFLILSQKVRPLLGQASVANWLYGVARRVAHNTRLSSSRRARRERAAAVPESVSPTDRLTGQELLAVLDEELDRLPRRYREPLVLCYLEGLTRDEAAVRLGVPQATLKSQLERGRKKLADALAARGCALGMLLLAAAATSLARASSPGLLKSTLAAAGGAASPAVAALAREVAVQIWTTKRMLPVAALVGMVAVGVGLSLAQPHPTGKPERSPDDRPAAKVDRFGDPLPDGAVFRLGTLGLRAPNLAGVGFRKTGELVGLGEDLALHVWPADGSAKATTTLLTGKKQNGWRRALSADARFAAGLVADGPKVVVWDVSGDKPVEYTSRSTKDAYGLAFSANGEWLAVNDTSRDRLEDLLLCHLPTKEWSALVLGGHHFQSLSFTPDGKRLVVTTDDDAMVIDTAQKKVLQRAGVPRERLMFAALSPDGKTLATLGMKWLLGPDQMVRLFSVETGRELTAFPLTVGSAWWVGFSPDGQALWAGGHHGLSQWDAATGKPVRKAAVPSSHPAAFSADRLRLASHTDSAVVLWDVKQGKAIRPDVVEGGHTAAIMGLTPSPDGTVIATDDIAGEVRLWDAATGRPLGRVRSSWGGGGAPRVAFLPDSQSFVAVADDYITPVLFESATGKELRRFAVSPDVAKKETAGELRLSADGKTLTTTGRPTTAGMKSYAVHWDVATGKVIDRTETARGERDEFFGPSYSPDGLWEVRNGAVLRVGEKEPVRVVSANETGLLRVQFSADSRLVALPRAPRVPAAGDRNRGSLVIYDLNARAQVSELATGRPLRHAFAPSGRQVAVFGSEEISLWDLPSCKKVWGVRIEHDSTIRPEAMAFTPDGRRLITGHDCTALVWDVTGARQRGGTSPAQISADELARLWDSLAGGDAVKAYRAEWELADRPADAVALIRDRLKPAKVAQAATVQALVAKLDANDFAEREEASKSLRELGAAAVPALRQVLKGELSAEQKKRVENVLAGAASPATLSGDSLRQVRAVSVLERSATADARKLLADLAAGNPEARLTKEATASAARMSRISAGKIGRPGD